MTTYAACRKAWVEPGGNDAANALDAAFPKGVCEVFSLADPERDAVDDEEIVARLLIKPLDYNADEILREKLTSVYSRGVSLIRTGASDAEIMLVIEKLLTRQGATGVAGAVVIRAADLRSIGSDARYFCVYDTDAADQVKHADLVGMWDRDISRSAWKKEEARRRRDLAGVMKARMITASSPADLLRALRNHGI